MQIDKKRMAVIVALAIMTSITVYLAVECFLTSSDLAKAEVIISKQKEDANAALFTKLFIDKVLLSSGTVSFEDRLQLENAVRNVSDPEVFKQWQEFVDCTDETKTQVIVGNMLKLLIGKISS